MADNFTNKTEAVIAYIKKLIDEKKLDSSGKIPSENFLSGKLGVSRVTVRRALSVLVSKEVIHTIKGKGSYALGYCAFKDVEITIPFIISSAGVESRFFDIYSGAQNYLSRAGFDTTLFSSDYSSQLERKTVSELFEAGFRDMLVVPVARADNSEFYAELIAKGANIVFIDQRPMELYCNYVHSNNFLGCFEIARHMINKGHRKIGYIYEELPELSSSTYDRIRGFKAALKQGGIPFTQELTLFSNRRTFEDSLNHLLSLPEPPTAIIANNDYSALAVMDILKQRGIRIPMDMAIAGFDNITPSASCKPSLTTVNQDFYKMGYAAGELISRIRSKNDGIITDIAIPVEVIHRKSI